MLNIVAKIFSALIILGTVFVLFIMGISRVDQYLKIKAMDDCGDMIRYEKTVPAENVKLSIPVQDLYEKCIKEKGY